MINSRKIDDLHPIVASKCRDFINKCDLEGIDVIIISTYRDLESQAQIYAQGRTKPGKIVTKAKPGESYHNYKVAFDFVPIIYGKAQWNNTELFEKCGKIAESCGLEWAGRWKKFKEMAHCQYTQGISLKAFSKGMNIA